MKNILGIHIAKGESFFHTWVELFHEISNTNFYILFVAITTLISALLIKRFAPKVSNLLIGLIVGSFVALSFSGSNANIQLVGEIPAHLPPLTLPDFSFASIKMLAPEAFAVALLGLIEAVSISRSIATKSNQRIDASQEFIGQGLSNMTITHIDLIKHKIIELFTYTFGYQLVAYISHHYIKP